MSEREQALLDAGQELPVATLQPVFDREYPVKGLVTALNPTSLGPGMLTEAQNLRISFDTARARNGSAAVLPGTSSNMLTTKLTGFPADCHRGFYYHSKTQMAFLAAFDGTNTRVFTYSPSNTGWYESTQSSGLFGNTRFTGDVHVEFAVVRERGYPASPVFGDASTPERLIMQGNGQTPRVLTIRDSTIPVAALSKAITAPDPGRLTAEPGPWRWWVPGNFPTITEGHTSMTCVLDSSTFLFERVGTSGALGSGAGASLDGTTSYDLSLAEQVWVVYEWPADELELDILNVDVFGLVTTAGAVELGRDIFRASRSGRTQPIVVDVASENLDWRAVLVAYPVPVGDAAAQIKPGDMMHGIQFVFDRLRKEEIPSKIRVGFVGLGKGPAGGSFLGVSYFNSFARAESPGAVARLSAMPSLGGLGWGFLRGTYLPLSAALRTCLRLKFNQPSATDLGTWHSDTALLYLRKPGSIRYDLLTTLAPSIAATGGGTWELPTGLTSPDNNVFRIIEVTNDLTSPRTLPDEQNEQIPPGTVMTVANNRLCVAQAQMAGSSNDGGLAVSDGEVPFRFSSFVRQTTSDSYDPTSATYLPFPGEPVMACATLSGQLLGNDSILALTDRSAWIVSGSDAFQLSRPTRQLDSGTLSPRSVAIYRGMAIWLDQRRQIVMYPSTAEPLSYKTIEDQFAAIPDSEIGAVAAAVEGDRYYVAFTRPSQSRNDRIAVFDFRQRGWTLDTPPTRIRSMQAFPMSGRSRLLVQGVTAAPVLEYDTPGLTTDSGTDISIAVSSRHFRSTPDGSVQGMTTLIECNSGSGSLTVTHAAPREGVSASGTVSLSGSVDVWRFATTAAVVGQRVSTRVSGTVPGGFEIRAIYLAANGLAGGVNA